MDANLRVTELGVQSLAEKLILLTLLAKRGVLGLEGVEGALKLVNVGLLALSRVLSRETVSSLTGFEASLALLVARFSATAGVGGLGGGLGG